MQPANLLEKFDDGYLLLFLIDPGATKFPGGIFLAHPRRDF